MQLVAATVDANQLNSVGGYLIGSRPQLSCVRTPLHADKCGISVACYRKKCELNELSLENIFPLVILFSQDSSTKQ